MGGMASGAGCRVDRRGFIRDTHMEIMTHRTSYGKSGIVGRLYHRAGGWDFLEGL